EVLSGLRKRQKEIPAKYFYDKRGSVLFQEICRLGEYYIPRTEIAIMKSRIHEIAGLLGAGILLIEYGCGDCIKTRILLDYLYQPAAFVPIDISREQLANVTAELAIDYPDLELLPLCADYTNEFSLPVASKPSERNVVYFPGSTIGNFSPDKATDFLRRINKICGAGGALLIGVDLKKDNDILNRAYNDKKGVTAAFNLNLLERINRELGADFQTGYFKHHSFYNKEEGRVEMHLISLKNQMVHLNGAGIPFAEGESIWTESSYKYGIDKFEKMAAAAGFRIERVWTDEKKWFGVYYLVSKGK
ncbi:L-histidine N(alpha)-methyltransferase, partial [Chloroflexota bacterium]